MLQTASYGPLLELFFFIETVQEFSDRLDNEVKKNVWEKIAQVCAKEFGKVITYKQVESKWKSLKRTYKSVIINNETSGKPRRHWEFFKKIHSFMHKRPEIIPEATCSSFAGLKRKSETAETNTNIKADEASIKPESSTNEAETTFCRKKKGRESDAAKRHKEKMARMDKFNTLFEKMIDKM